MGKQNAPVVWILSYFAGGPSYCPRVPDYCLAEFLQRNGYVVKIFAGSALHNTDKNFITDGQRSKSQIVDGVPFVFIKTRSYTSRRGEVLSFIDYYRNLMKEYRKYGKPDLVIAAMPQPLACLAGIQISKKLKVPYITSIVDLWPLSIVEYADYSSRNPIILAMYGFEKWVYIKSDELVFTWEGAYDYILDKHWEKKIPKSKFHYINIGIDLKTFNENRQLWRIDDPDLDEGKFVVMYCGSIRQANDIGTVVDAAGILCREGLGDKISFVIYGDGPDREVLSQRCQAEGITNVCFKGSIEKKYIPYVLSKSSLNILNLKKAATQKYGNSSNKLFEYLASGNPVIANIDEGKYPIISKYGCGKVVEAGSAEAYAEGIKYFFELPTEEMENYRQSALDAVRDFDTELLNRRWEGIIHQALKRENGT